MKENEVVKNKLDHELSCGCGCCGGDAVICKSGKGYLRSNLKEFLKIVISFVLIIASLFVENYIFKLSLCIFAALICGMDLINKCLNGIRRKNLFNENSLMLIASITAFILNESFEGAMIIALFTLGEFLEGAATFSSKKRIDSLSKFQVVIVHLVQANGVKNVDPNEVEVGSLIQINKGEMVAIDGILLCGVSEFDTKSITGESNYKSINCGENVYSGYINLGETIVIKTIKKYNYSTTQKIAKIIEGSLSNKAKSQKFISSFAKKYTPIVCLLALLIAVVLPFFDALNFSKWIYKALVFLVVSCPCALVISVPLAFFIGIGSLAKNGILVKSSMCVEHLSNIEEVVFDKTGTLTTAEFTLDKIVTFNEYEKAYVLECVSAIEKNSTHPIARSLASLTKTKLKARETIEHSGKGISGIIDGAMVLVGNYNLMTSENIVVDREHSDALTIYVAIDDKLAAKLYLYDKIKERAKNAISNLAKDGVGKICVLSGDNKTITKRVCEKLGIVSYKSELLTDEKVNALLDEKESAKGKIMFVGDGVNDAPSLSVADIGVAMGGLGSDMAIDVADVVIMDDDISKIPLLLKHSKKVSRIVKQNIIGSISIKVLIMLLGVLFTLPMGIAMFADVGVMLIAVLNAFRCGNIKGKVI